MTSSPLASTARLAGLLALLSLPAPAQSDVTDVVEHGRNAVVSVDVLFAKIDSPGRAAQNGVNAVRVERPGSGVLVDGSGLVLTAAHLVEQVREGSDEYWVRVGLASGGERRATIVHRDEAADLALLRIEGREGARYPALPLAPAGDEPVGARVVALSAPAGSHPYSFAGALAFAAGPVTLREATLEPWQVLLSDCRFHDLLDGGPLLNTRGEVIGLHNSSHLSPRPEGFGGAPEEGEEPEEDRDYAVIVSGEAVLAAMGEHLRGADTLEPLAPRPADMEPAVAAIERISPSVVSVHHRQEGEHPASADPADPQSRRLPEGLGSGVVVDPSGLVLTTSHLFEDEEGTTTVRLADGRVLPARLLARSPASQVALLAVELPEGETLPAARPVDSATLAQGEAVAVVARPYAPAVHMSVGVLSALEREGLVQLASWVHPGHRGGAVVDRDGRLIGIAVREPASFGRADQDSYLGFAAPISTALAALEEAWTATGAASPLVDATDAELEARRTPVSGVAERTRSSLINVLVSQAVEKPSTGFDPFGGSGEEEFQLLGQGSGVIIEASGLALSNWHVVDAALARNGTQSESSRVEVTLPDGRRFEARVLSTSRDDDLALLALQIGPEDELVPVELGDSDDLRPGQPVVAIGNPLGLANSVSAGIVSTLGLDTRIQGRLREYKGMVMTDAAINPGNSGGALLDLDGRLVGINSAGRVGAGMAIPVNKAREVFSDKLLSAKSLKAAYLGMEVVDRGGELVVDSVDEEGPAARAGVRVEDRIRALAGRETAAKTAFARIALDLDAAAPCPITVEREGQSLELELLPVSFAAWTIARATGIEVVEVDYGAEAQLVGDASVALYRAYTQRESGEPSRLMAGALRVTRVGSLLGKERPAVEVGDLLLGITSITAGTTAVHERLVRFESLADLSGSITPLYTKDGATHLFWLWRDGEIVATEVFVRRPGR